MTIYIQFFKYIAFLLILINVSCAFRAQTITGNVYSFEGKCEKWSNVYINAIKIEDKVSDTILMTVSYDKELFRGITLIYDDKIRAYKSTEKIVFFSENNYTSDILLKLKGIKNIELQYEDSLGIVRTYQYIFTYKGKSNHSKFQNPYYAEDGFGICQW